MDLFHFRDAPKEDTVVTADDQDEHDVENNDGSQNELDDNEVEKSSDDGSEEKTQ